MTAPLRTAKNTSIAYAAILLTTFSSCQEVKPQKQRQVLRFISARLAFRTTDHSGLPKNYVDPSDRMTTALAKLRGKKAFTENVNWFMFFFQYMLFWWTSELTKHSSVILMHQHSGLKNEQVKIAVSHLLAEQYLHQTNWFEVGRNSKQETRSHLAHVKNNSMQWWFFDRGISHDFVCRSCRFISFTVALFKNGKSRSFSIETQMRLSKSL